MGVPLFPDRLRFGSMGTGTTQRRRHEGEPWQAQAIGQDSFGARATLDVDGKEYEIFRLDAVEGDGPRRCGPSLPYSLKVLLENLLRTEDGANITADDIQALAGWDADADPSRRSSSRRRA